jgi:methylthioribulose-1-phosphate dehydratase
MSERYNQLLVPHRAFEANVAALRDIGKLFYRRGWSVGTSSNYSMLLGHEPFELLLTASGKDKRRLGKSDFVVVDQAGKLLAGAKNEKPSAETGLHLILARRPGIGSVLHTHSVWGTLLSDLHGDAGGLWIEGYEMLKGLAGVTTHQHREWVEIFPNSQDIADLSRRVEIRLNDTSKPPLHGFLLRNHGLYTWGRDLDEARRHIEIFEFLFEILVRRLGMTGR